LKQKKLYNALNNILMIFLVIQPFLDVYMALVGEKLDIFGISVVTILRTLFATVMFVIVIISQIKYKYHIKYIWVILGYLLVVVVYTILHHINIVNFNGYFITEGIYSAITELFYVLRLVIPILLIYIVIITRPCKKELIKVVLSAVIIISVVIIATNIFKVSFASYSQTNKIIKYNVIDWFTKDSLSYEDTLSKGFFVSANQIGALLVFFLPIVIYHTLKENKWYLYLILLAQIVSMVLVGTRVANYGWILVSIAMIIMYIILHFTKKHKLSLQPLIWFAIILEISSLLYIYSPAHTRIFASTYEGMYSKEMEENEEVEFLSIQDFNEVLQSKDKMQEYLGKQSNNLVVDAKTKYISETYKYHYITNKYILEIYPYEDDLDFWLGIFEQPISVKGDNRERQVAIIKRIKANNNNEIMDTLFGMGATPLNSRGYMIENDLISHYYNLGIIGIILFVAPFVFGICYSLYKNRKNITNIVNVEFAVFVLAILMAYFIGYFAGHVIDEYIISIYLGVTAGIITNFYRKEEKE